MTAYEQEVERITEAVARRFRTFGGGKVTPGNPLSAALKDAAPQFAAGVDVREVVCFVLDAQVEA